MTAAERLKEVSVEDYLAGELLAKRKHEYLAGRIYAMAGGTNAHNLIATNATGSLVSSLRGKPCRAYNSDTKVRITLGSSTHLYYPDAMVVCEPKPAGETFQDKPVLIIEVLSKGTRRVDEEEKRVAYLSLPTLKAYLLVEQSEPEVRVYRRGKEGFKLESYSGFDASVPLPELDLDIRLADLYEGVVIAPEPVEDDV